MLVKDSLLSLEWLLSGLMLMLSTDFRFTIDGCIPSFVSDGAPCSPRVSAGSGRTSASERSLGPMVDRTADPLPRRLAGSCFPGRPDDRARASDPGSY